MQAETLQSESQQPKHQTQAEQYADLIEAIDSVADDADLSRDNELTRDGLLNQSRSHSISTSQVDQILEFADGSLYDCEDGEVAKDMAEYLDALDTVNVGMEDADFPSTGSILVWGTVESAYSLNPIDLPLNLTDMYCDGSPYLLGSSDTHEEPTDTAPIEYTHALQSLIGKRVLVRCTPSKYTEQRSTPRGNGYHVDVDYLTCPLVIPAADNSVTHKGVVIQLTEPMHRDSAAPYYSATGEDAEGNEYDVRWKTEDEPESESESAKNDNVREFAGKSYTLDFAVNLDAYTVTAR